MATLLRSNYARCFASKLANWFNVSVTQHGLVSDG
jgi:hypothetical protein